MTGKITLLFAASALLLTACAGQTPAPETSTPALSERPVTSGGELSDGLELRLSSADDGLRFSFFSGGESASVPRYTAESLGAPERMEFMFYGVREVDREAAVAAAESVDGVSAAYFIMVADDSAVGFVVERERGSYAQLHEEKERLTMEFEPVEEGDEIVYWYLRSDSLPYGEEPAMLCEQYAEFQPHQVRTASGNFAVVIGSYGSEDDAKTALAQLPEGSPFYAASSKQYEPLGD